LKQKETKSSLGLLFILRTDASGFPDMLYLVSKLHGITYHKTVMFCKHGVENLKSYELVSGVF
jgi:hypothetical protein